MPEESFPRISKQPIENMKEFFLTAHTHKYKIEDVKNKERKNNPPPPYTTSTLQQDCNNKLNLSPKICMKDAQRLYESGKITYMRTDSVDISSDCKKKIKKWVVDTHGENFYKKRSFKNCSKNSQEAHEAIRPVKISITELPFDYSAQEKRVYELIWKRAVASQMAQEIVDVMNIKIIPNKNDGKPAFRTTYYHTKFKGFKILYNTAHEEELPEIKVGEEVKPLEFKMEETATHPKNRYSEASLIKELEKDGIGRPSTYSNIISTLFSREYILNRIKVFASNVIDSF